MPRHFLQAKSADRDIQCPPGTLISLQHSDLAGAVRGQGWNAEAGFPFPSLAGSGVSWEGHGGGDRLQYGVVRGQGLWLAITAEAGPTLPQAGPTWCVLP